MGETLIDGNTGRIMGLEDYSKQHKKAWEYDAYDFWVRTAGTPEERASKDKAGSFIISTI